MPGPFTYGQYQSAAYTGSNGGENGNISNLSEDEWNNLTPQQQIDLVFSVGGTPGGWSGGSTGRHFQSSAIPGTELKDPSQMTRDEYGVYSTPNSNLVDRTGGINWRMAMIPLLAGGGAALMGGEGVHGALDVGFFHQRDARHMLSDDRQRQLADILDQNPILHIVDISKNPIGPKGAQALISTLIERNQTLTSLGDLSMNEMMGVRIREELKQALMLNNASHDKKKAFIEQKTAETSSKFVDCKDVHQPDNEGEKIVVPASKQQMYPLLKPVLFTNQNDQDDYLTSGVWILRK